MSDTSKLSAREVEIIQLRGEGQSNRQIAEALKLAVSTVKNHIAHVADKVGIRKTSAIVAHLARQTEFHP